jgi:predicted HTH transcriptional regulator
VSQGIANYLKPQIIPTISLEIMDNYINVVIPFEKDFEYGIENRNDLTLTKAQGKIYTILKNNPNYTIKELVRESGLSDGYVRKIIGYLKENGYLRRVGSNKSGYWETKKL